MRVPYIRRLGFGLAAAALAVGVAACSSSSSTGTTTTTTSGGAPEMTNVKVGILSASDDAPLIIGIKDGYFKKQGLNVSYTIMPMISGASSEALKMPTLTLVISGAPPEVVVVVVPVLELELHAATPTASAAAASPKPRRRIYGTRIVPP